MKAKTLKRAFQKNLSRFLLSISLVGLVLAVDASGVLKVVMGSYYPFTTSYVGQTCNGSNGYGYNGYGYGYEGYGYDGTVDYDRYVGDSCSITNGTGIYICENNLIVCAVNSCNSGYVSTGLTCTAGSSSSGGSSGGGGGGGGRSAIVKKSTSSDDNDKDSGGNNDDDSNDGSSTPNTTPFSDVNNHWSTSYVNTLYELGYVNGINGEFKPELPSTRAELVKLSVLGFEVPLVSSETKAVAAVIALTADQLFTDVDSNAWYAVYIASAKAAGILQGYADGSFKPNQAVTRAEALKIILVASGVEIEDANTNFSDVRAGSWYEDYVAYAQENGIVNGYTDGTFRPHQNITRAEIVKIIVKVMKVAS